MTPIYDIEKTYSENFQMGPFFEGEIPKRKRSKGIEFLGHRIGSPLGVPAGPLLNSKWIALAASLGFDVLVYKTIRSFAHPGHRLPNMVFVEPMGGHTARKIDSPPENLSFLSVTNSFGMPSQSPDFLLQDIERAKKSLKKDQLLIVSVVGTPNHGVSFRDDFVKAALLAKEGGALVIEANFSCPNVGKSEGSLYMSPETVYEFSHAIAKAIHPIPLLLKIGEVQDKKLLEAILMAGAKGGASGVCGLNSIGMRVLDRHDGPALGKGREISGVCGSAIRTRALHFIRESSEIIQTCKLDLSLAGCGGVTMASHFDEFLEAGAQVAMSATGMMWDPLLASRYHGR